MWTKQQLIDEAFSELALQGFVFNLDEDMMQTALRRLDAMMATWNGKGLRLGYALPSTPEASSLSSPSGLPDWANEAVFLALSIRQSSGLGKTVSQATVLTAKAAYEAVLMHCAFPQEQQLPSTLPRGAGNKAYRVGGNPFFPQPIDPILAGPDAPIEFT
jgi:hypothetical protein